LLLLATAVALIAQGVIAARLRTADTLSQIGRYGFAGVPDLQPEGGLRGFLNSAAAGIGLLLTERLKLINEVRLRKTLVAAGMYDTSPRMLIGYQLLAGLAFPAIWIWLAAASGATASLTIIAAIFFAGIGWFGPGFVVQRRAETRLYRIDRGMPELIDLLVVTVEAGLSLTAALQLAGERMKGPLGDELRIMLQEQRMGLTPVQALENMVGRCPTPAVESFTRAMVQGQLLGVSVGQILRSLAVEMRKRRRAAAEQQAQKAPIKMLFPLVFMIFPALFVVILGPAIVSIFHALKG
jgi:tight adherence protein C